MTDLFPFVGLFDRSKGEILPLPDSLGKLISHLAFPRFTDRAWVITNFVSTLDGVISLNEPGRSSGGDISGFNRHDRALMGLLRAAADAVIVGAGQLRKPPGTVWLPTAIFPDFAGEYAELRRRMQKPSEPLQVVVSASGRLDPSLPIFQTPGLEVLVLTTKEGQQRLSQSAMADKVELRVCAQSGEIQPEKILDEINQKRTCQLALIEGGPGLTADFLAAGLLDELFLTLAPQVAGRDNVSDRPGFVEGRKFAPFDERWSELYGILQAGSHLFLRYRFSAPEV